MSRISSLTETTGLRSPQSSGTGGGTGVGFDEEHAAVKTPMANSPAQMASGLRVRTSGISPLRVLDHVVIDLKFRRSLLRHRSAIKTLSPANRL